MEPRSAFSHDCLSPEWRTVWEGVQSAAASAASNAASLCDVEVRDLRTQLMLHLPRFPLPSLHADNTIANEALRLAKSRADAIRPYRSWFKRERGDQLHRNQAVLSETTEDVMRTILEAFHYVHSYRSGLHFGLELLGVPFPPAAVLTLSPLDVAHLHALLPTSSKRANAMVVSRLFAFDWAPHNSTSYLVGLVRRWLLRHRPNVTMLFTYINPNLGFDAASWRACNWRRIGFKSVQYRYLNGNYISAREYAALVPELRRCVEFARYQLQPLEIWTLPIKVPEPCTDARP